jgi:hypothetical protein
MEGSGVSTGRRSVVVIENFYADPMAVRQYALTLPYYLPYQEDAKVLSGEELPQWWASRFRSFEECPFKSSEAILEALESAVDEEIDRNHWRAPCHFDDTVKPCVVDRTGNNSCLWNATFHVKLNRGKGMGHGVHNHVTDSWNSVGTHGWAGVLYLTPRAPLDRGLHLWENIPPGRRFDWMTPPSNWRLVDSFGNVFNRLVLCRGDIPHSGSGGWGTDVATGRMFQTFFFRTHPRATRWPVALQSVGGVGSM